MSALIVTNGKVSVATGAYAPSWSPAARYDTNSTHAHVASIIDKDGNEILPIIYQGKGPDVGEVWRDEHGVNWRVLSAAPDPTRWITLGTVMHWLSATHKQVMELHVRGLLDGVVVHGSGVRYYLVRDMGRCEAELQRLVVARAPKSRTPKKKPHT